MGSALDALKGQARATIEALSRIIAAACTQKASLQAGIISPAEVEVAYAPFRLGTGFGPLGEAIDKANELTEVAWLSYVKESDGEVFDVGEDDDDDEHDF